MCDQVPAMKTDQSWLLFCSKLYNETLLIFTAYSMYNEQNPEEICTNPFPQQYTLNGSLHFLTTVAIINTNLKQNITNNFNSNVQKVKYKHSFITN